jgi:hypothetical protein
MQAGYSESLTMSVPHPFNNGICPADAIIFLNEMPTVQSDMWLAPGAGYFFNELFSPGAGYWIPI